MKKLANILIIFGAACYIAAIISKLSQGILYAFDIKPMSAIVFGNACLLLSLVIDGREK